MAKKSWKDFPVAFPPPKKGFDDRCLRLDEVTHVAHVADAIRVVEDRRIRSSLVYDESCLNTKRTQVSWVSPKTWAHGYIYGNVAFAFDWGKLVEGHKVYWVEHRQTSGQDICRFLVCDDTFTEHPLEEYDYTKPHGPLFYDGAAERWYHNNRVTSEYMVLDDLRLSDCVGIRFVDHHPSYCNKNGSSCAELGRSRDDAGAEAICKLIGTGQTHVARLFESRGTPGEVDSSVDSATWRMSRRIIARFDPARAGTVTAPDRAEVMKATMLACGWHQKERVAALLAQFPSKKACENSFWSCLMEFFSGLKLDTD